MYVGFKLDILANNHYGTKVLIFSLLGQDGRPQKSEKRGKWCEFGGRRIR